MFTMSDQIGDLAVALAKAQGELKPAAMNCTNPFLKVRYADLGAVIEAAKLVLPRNGLAYSQLPVDVGEQVGLTTILMHSSGQWISSTISLKNMEEHGKSGAQIIGSNISYLRRYALASLIGIYADEDADGETTPTPQSAPKPIQQPKTTPAQISRVTMVPQEGAEFTGEQPLPAQKEDPVQSGGAAWTRDIAAVKRVTNFAFGGNGLSENELHEALGGKLHDYPGSEKQAIEAIKSYIHRKAAQPVQPPQTEVAQ